MRSRLEPLVAGVGVPTTVVGQVRIQGEGYAWISCAAGHCLVTDRAEMLGPLTIQTARAWEPGVGEPVEIAVRCPRRRSPPAPAARAVAPPAMPRLTHAGVARCAAQLGSQPLSLLAAEMAGLGPGLTPSGDDVLAGYLLARQAVDRDAAEGEARQVLDAMRVRSGELAIELARWAAEGESFALALDARDALLGHGDLGAWRRLGALGGETGSAMLAGMVAALRSG